MGIRRLARGGLPILLMAVAISCVQSGQSNREESDAGSCVMPTQRTTLLDQDGAVLETWRFRREAVHTEHALPSEPAFLEYRAAVERDGADSRRPVSDPPVVETEAEAAVWLDEDYNNGLAYDSAVGAIEPISCLDALLLARQAGRVSQLDQPTEFLASVLRRESEGATDILVVFGAGLEMFVPREAYGLDVVESLLGEGWSYWYAIHNHTLQRNGDRLALGVPVPSTSDVQMSRSLAERIGLDSVRVTNGFYTFRASVSELDRFRSR